MSLPVNVIVILALATLVLGGVAFFFQDAARQGGSAVSIERAYADGCNVLRYVQRCSSGPENVHIRGFDPDGTAGTDGATLARACELKFGWQKDDSTKRPTCKTSCGCLPESTSTECRPLGSC